MHTSRSSFATAFRTPLGRPPPAHLLRRRVRNAAEALRDGDRSRARSPELGHASEKAFNNAFQRVTGCRPTHCRSAARRASQPELGFARPTPTGAPRR
ncbi:helix-turn-helix domain-containing protein [Streptomyces sp. NPDC060223]|uniref:helix-turn-helix domain-containing protein n=1 Tax=unclassified Streptomyces TaxID=2593676 RepID=UPI00362D3F4C